MNQPQAKVAIVTRTKNRPVLLRRALQSILAQSYDDYVVVLVNDAGERDCVDECVAEVAEQARDRIHVVHNEKSNGREAAMNIGLRNSQSEYVVIHDDDDTWAPSFLEKTVAHLDGSSDGGAAVRTAVIYERIDGETVTREREEILASDMHDVTLFEVIRRNYVPPISLLYRRSIHDEVGEYGEDLPVLADWEFLLRLLRQHQVGFIDGEPLAYWHHRESASGDLGNSIIADADDHQSYDRTIRDRYLREDLARHDNLGSLLYFTELIDRGEKLSRIQHEQNILLAHNINNTTSALATDFDSRLREAAMLHAETAGKINQSNLEIAATNDRIATTNDQLVEINRNLVSQNNRLVAQLEAVNGRIDELEGFIFSQTPRQRMKSWKALARRKGSGVVRRFRR